MTERREFYRRRLPHWQPPGATMFVTFRLAGSLPYSVITELRAEYQRQKAVSSRITDPDEQLKQADLDARRSFGRWDYALDNTDYGPRWLAEEQVATVVAQALYYRDQRVYDLYAFCIMPNHAQHDKRTRFWVGKEASGRQRATTRRAR